MVYDGLSPTVGILTLSIMCGVERDTSVLINNGAHTTFYLLFKPCLIYFFTLSCYSSDSCPTIDEEMKG